MKCFKTASLFLHTDTSVHVFNSCLVGILNKAALKIHQFFALLAKNLSSFFNFRPIRRPKIPKNACDKTLCPQRNFVNLNHKKDWWANIFLFRSLQKIFLFQVNVKKLPEILYIYIYIYIYLFYKQLRSDLSPQSQSFSYFQGFWGSDLDSGSLVVWPCNLCPRGIH